MYAMELKIPRKRKRKEPRRITPELPDELVLEILVRLPVKSLLRFMSVSKAWHAIIRDPVFIRMHLQHTTSKWKESPSFLITPHTLDRVIPGELWPTTFSTQIRLYQWQLGASEARLVHGVDFPAGEFSSVCYFVHYDGLVVFPTDSKVYLFNPATRDTITLPDSDRNKICHDVILPVGFGRDPRSGRYKVVRAFFRSRDPLTEIYHMGMEVFTVGDAAATWRETAADPPYPVADWLTAKFVNGGLFWIINKHHQEPRPYGILRFSLEDETFSVTCLPDSLDPALDESYLLDVMHMHGELCLTAFSSSGPKPYPVRIWVLVENDGARSRWEQRYSLHITEMIHPMILLPGGAIMIRACQYLCRYQLEVPELTVMCELGGLRYHRRRAGTFEPAGQKVFYFDVTPYTKSLVPVTAYPA